MSHDEWIQPPASQPLTGEEAFVGLDATVRDFWRFAIGDLRVNSTRGTLAEFLVAEALGLNSVKRADWDAFDLLLDGDVRVEVKSSAYLQVWEQRKLSVIRFSGLRGTRYHPQHDYDPAGPQLNAHVYVFCVQTAVLHSEYEPLDPDQWQFYVVPKSQLENHGRSIGLAVVAGLVEGVTPWAELGSAVREAAVGQTVNDEPWWAEPGSSNP